jgi:septal ring factor EnvC (AmiA/AmiB activator)
MAPTVKELQARVEALQQRLAPKESLAERLKAKRERWRAMSPEQRDAARAARFEKARTCPPPPAGTMRNRLWHAELRLAAMLATGADTRLR